MTQSMEDLKQMSGESAYRRHKYNVPSIKFHGTDGTYTILRQVDGGLKTEEIESNPVCIILKVRRALAAYTKEAGGTESKRTWSSEVDSTEKEKMILFEKRKSEEKARIIDRGFAKQLKKDHSDLKTQFVLYILYKEEVFKLKVKGGSLGNLFDYFGLIPSDGAIFDSYTKLGVQDRTNDGGLQFKAITFERDAGVLPKGDFDKVAEKIKDVHSNLELMKKSGEDQNSEPPEHEHVPAQLDSDAPPESSEEDMKVEDIDF